MKKKVDKIESSTEAWESGLLGRDEDFIKISDDIKQDLIDDSLELQMISIRLQKTLIEDMKMIASLHGIGYQPLIRQIIARFANCEKKQLLREIASKRKEEERLAKEAEDLGSSHAA